MSRGFSAPTIAELLPSTGVISTDLEGEYGWNYEMTVSYALFKRHLRLEATGFYFKLNNSLVQRRDLSGADYFVNAGDVQHKGIELYADYLKSFTQKCFVDYFQITGNYTCNHFRYGSFVRGTNDFSGKTVPSVPANTFSLTADIQFKYGLYSNTTYYAASKIFMNDANPWPTPFPQGGFDLDAVGVIHQKAVGIHELKENSLLSFYPNPAKDKINIQLKGINETASVILTDVLGNIRMEQEFKSNSSMLNMSELSSGIYFISIHSGNKVCTKKIIKE